MATFTGEYTKAVVTNFVSQTSREKSAVMFHLGRSGSTVLGDLFNQNQELFWDSEIFMDNRMPTDFNTVHKMLFRLPMLTIKTRRMRTKKRIYGFEAKLSHIARIRMSPPQFVEEIKKLGFAYFLLLRRRNHLRIIISDLVAQQKGYWHSPSQGTTHASGLTPVTINVNAITLGSCFNRQQRPLMEHLCVVEEEFAQLTTLLEGQHVLNLVYEDDIEQDPSIAYHKVCEFLAVTPTPVEVRLRKTNPWPMHQLINNYEEVAETLAGSPYEWMLKT